MGFLEAVEDVSQEEASIRKMFGEDARRVRDRRRTPEYMKNLLEAANFIADVEQGKRPMHHLREAMTTSDFPVLMADVLDRQLLAGYREMDPVWSAYLRRGTVPDFRKVQRVAVDGSEGRLDEVGEVEEYPEGEIEESQDEYRVKKYGKRLDLSWEAMVNDDLDAFRNLPDRLARGARRTEQYLATTLIADEDGPHADLYDADNTIEDNPELSFDALEAGLQVFADQVDNDGEPIIIDGVTLVIPQALEVRAMNIMNATEIESETTDGLFRTRNWMANKLKVVVDPYLPYVISGAKGKSSWFMFADPNSGRAAAEIGFLRGYEDPALYERVPDARRVGGGEVPEAFSDDSMAWKVRHVVGGGQLVNTGGKKATVASNGSGS